MNNSYLWIIILGLVVLNFILIINYNKINSEKVVSDSIAQLSINETPERESYFHRPIDNISYKKIKTESFTLVVIIPENSCALCLKYDTPLLNKFNSIYKKNLRVYYLGKDNFDYLRGFDRTFEYEFITSPEKVLSNYDKGLLHLEKPTYLLIDKNSQVQSIYRTNLTQLELSDIFFSNMHSLFEGL